MVAIEIRKCKLLLFKQEINEILGKYINETVHEPKPWQGPVKWYLHGV